MCHKAVLIFFLIFLQFSCSSQDFKRHIVFLASDSLHGRAPATADEKNAAAYIAGEFRKAGCSKVVFQKFPFENDSAINVLGYISNKRDSTIIISAHYDHLGWGSDKSLEIVPKRGIYHGADDNASGVAMMIETARWVSKHKERKYNFLFAGYSGHEEGLYGSGFFSKSSLCQSLKIKALINFDMVGRMDTSSKTIRISGVYSDSLFSRYFAGQQHPPLNFIFNDANIHDSDLRPFEETGIPMLNFFTGVHNDYHRKTDTEDKINYPGMKLIYELVTKLIGIM